MKEESVIKNQKGFSTIEIMVAFALLMIVLTSVISVTLGNQSISSDSQTNHEALLLTKKKIENVTARLRFNFNAQISSIFDNDPFYKEDIEIKDISPCAKKVKSKTSWNNELRPQILEITTEITSPEESKRLGGLCDPSPPITNWDTTKSLDILSPNDFSGKGTGITLAYVNGTRYAFLTTDASTPNSNNFYSINTNNPAGITANDIVSLKVGESGLNGIAVANNYAYVLNNGTTSHLLVVDISDPLNPKHLVKASTTLPNITNGRARSIFYYDKKLYIGTEFVSPNQNNELHIFDVSDYTNPKWQASTKVNRNVNSIVVRNGLAYLATGSGTDNTPLKIYDVNPNSPTYLQKVSEFTNQNNWHGTSIYLLGNKIYLGLERRSPSSQQGAEFYILDASNLSVLGSKGLNLTPASSAGISGIIVQGNLAFLITTASNERLFVIDVSNPSNPTKVNTCPFSSLPQVGTDIAYADDLVFLSMKDNKAFRIIYPANACL